MNRLCSSILGLLVSAIALDAEAAFSPRTVSIGHSWELGGVVDSNDVVAPGASDQGAIVGIGIAGSNDHVYVWYADGTVSSGTSTHFAHYQARVPFVLPEGKEPFDIISIAIAPNDRVYTYYADGTVSEGWSQDLGAYRDPAEFTLPPGLVPSDIVGTGIAADDHFYTWYADGTVSEGWSRELDAYTPPYQYVLPANKKIGHIIDIEIAASSDLVYTWYQDVETGTVHSTFADSADAKAMDILRRYRLPGLSVSASKNGRVVMQKGYGYANFTDGTRMSETSRCRIGSVSKIITSLSAMHLDQTRTDFSVSQKLYGVGGVLAGSNYTNARNTGTSRYRPIVDKAIASNDRVYTWYHNGMVSSGNTTNPSAHTGLVGYTLAPNMGPEDVRAIAIAPNDWVWVWYEDGTFGAGSSTNLNANLPRNPDSKVSLPAGYSMDYVVSIDFAPNNQVYVWYDDGMTSAGTVSDFDANIAPRTYVSAANKSRYTVRAVAIAKSNSHVYAWFNDGTVTEGTSRDFDAYAGPSNYSVPAAAYDPNKNYPAWYSDMRVNHLMSHSAGFDGGGDTAAAAKMYGISEDALSYAQVHEYVLATRKPLFAPGTAESYSNHGAGTVGHIVAAVSGMTYNNYARTFIIDPLGLNIRSGAQTSADTYRHEYESGIPVAMIDDPTNELGLAAGGWKSSGGDLVRLMLGTDKNPNHPDVLSAESIDLMETRPYEGASTFAHGWDKNNRGKLAHSGRLGGGTSYVAKYPVSYLDAGSAAITVAVCTNIAISDARGGSSSLANLAEDLAKMVDAANIPASYDLY